MTTYSIDINYALQEILLDVFIHPDDVAAGLEANRPVRFWVRKYHPSNATLWWELPGETAEHFWPGHRSYGEEIRETLLFEYGWATRSTWDRQGNQREYRDGFRFEEKVHAETAYESAYRLVSWTPPASGEYSARFYYGASATPDKEVIVTFTVGTAGSAGGSPDPKLTVQRTSNETIEPGTAHRIRAYCYHPGGDTLAVWAMSGVSATYVSGGNESFTETVMLRNGGGTTSLFDGDGNNTVSVPSLSGTEIAFHSVTYSAPYRDYDVTGTAADTPYAVLFYYEGEAEQVYQFSCEDVAAPPDPVIVDRTIQAYNHQTDAAEANASVWVDGVAKGQTDGSGNLTITGLTQGQTYALKITKAGFLDTDADTLANDSFVA